MQRAQQKGYCFYSRTDILFIYFVGSNQIRFQIYRLMKTLVERFRKRFLKTSKPHRASTLRLTLLCGNNVVRSTKNMC